MFVKHPTRYLTIWQTYANRSCKIKTLKPSNKLRKWRLSCSLKLKIYQDVNLENSLSDEGVKAMPIIHRDKFSQQFHYALNGVQYRVDQCMGWLDNASRSRQPTSATQIQLTTWKVSEHQDTENVDVMWSTERTVVDHIDEDRLKTTEASTSSDTVPRNTTTAAQGNLRDARIQTSCPVLLYSLPTSTKGGKGTWSGALSAWDGTIKNAQKTRGTKLRSGVAAAAGKCHRNKFLESPRIDNNLLV